LLNESAFDKDKSLTKYCFHQSHAWRSVKIVSNYAGLCPIPLAYAGFDEDSLRL